MTKLLFLPRCLNKEQLEKLKKAGKRASYKVYITNGSSIIKKILKKFKKIDKIIGIACRDEINLAEQYTKYLRKKGTETIEINLLKDGCKNTEVNLQQAINKIK